MDFSGHPRQEGGDDVDAKMTAENGDIIDTFITDNEDGTYTIEFTPTSSGPHSLEVKILQRHIKDSPVCVEVVDSNPPLVSFGSRGLGDLGLVQPCSLTIGGGEEVYVVDTGNSRLKVLSADLQFRRHLMNESLEGRSVTGICLGPTGETLILVNWRTRTISQITRLDGLTISSFSHQDLVEPTALALSTQGDIYVADNGAAAVLVFSLSGQLKQRITLSPR